MDVTRREICMETPLGLEYVRLLGSPQERGIDRWLGADNRGGTTEVDRPGCMPGPVDDEVNLLFYQMWTRSVATMNGFTA
jgi:hypothetical protein